MLVLTRKRGQSIIINNNVEIYVSSIEGETVKLGVRAPDEVVILRKELVDEVQASNLEASSVRVDSNLIKNIKKT